MILALAWSSVPHFCSGSTKRKQQQQGHIWCCWLLFDTKTLGDGVCWSRGESLVCPGVYRYHLSWVSVLMTPSVMERVLEWKRRSWIAVCYHLALVAWTLCSCVDITGAALKPDFQPLDWYQIAWRLLRTRFPQFITQVSLQYSAYNSTAVVYLHNRY